jgi:hypothetical protein
LPKDGAIGEEPLVAAVMDVHKHSLAFAMSIVNRIQLDENAFTKTFL